MTKILVKGNTGNEFVEYTMDLYETCIEDKNCEMILKENKTFGQGDLMYYKGDLTIGKRGIEK